MNTTFYRSSSKVKFDIYKGYSKLLSLDNGGTIYYGGNNYPLRGWKFSLWEGGIRGIGFVSGGDNITLQRNVVHRGLVHVSDWFPTLLSVAGGNLNGTKPLDGVNQWRSIRWDWFT